MSGGVSSQAEVDCRDLVQLLNTFFNPLRAQLDLIQRHVAKGVEQETYTVDEAARRLNLTRWTVRQACNLGRIQARKVPGRGKKGQWRITHDELERVKSEGLSSPQAGSRSGRRPQRRQLPDITPATGPIPAHRRRST